MEIEAQSANEIWSEAFSCLLSDTGVRLQTSRAGNTRELLHVLLQIHNPRQRWVTARFPGINPAFAIAEVIWILNGRNDAAFLNYWNHELPKFAGDDEYYHGAYGHRLRRRFGFDQLDRAYQALMNNPDTRQINLQIWDATSDFPYTDGQAVNSDIPCNTNALLKVRDGKLEWTQIMRSNDIILGLPHNIIQFTTLQEVIAGWLGLEVGTYSHFSDSLHVYEKHLGEFQSQPTNLNITNTDRLSLPKNTSDEAFQELNQIFDNIIQLKLSKQQLWSIGKHTNLPVAHKNMLLVGIAEVARRSKWLGLAQQLIEDCSNPMLRAAWDNWISRFAKTGLVK